MNVVFLIFLSYTSPYHFGEPADRQVQDND